MKKRLLKRLLTFSIFIMTVASLLAGCGSDSGGSDSDTITIGVTLPLSGAVAGEGVPSLDAINLAVKQVNEAGGINGRQIKIISEDDEASPTSAASLANKLVDNDAIIAVIGSYNSSCALAQVDIFAEGNLPVISSGATSPALTGCSDYFYRTAPNDAVCGTQAADFLHSLGLTKIALFYENDDYGVGIANTFRAQCETLGMEIVTTQTFVYGETVDFSTQLTATAATDAEAMFVAGCVTEPGLICDQRSNYGCGNLTVLLGNGAYTKEIFDYSVEGVYIQGEFDSNANDKAKQFVSDFLAEYGYEPGNWAACAYDAANIIIEAMKNVDGEITREAVNEQIAAITYEGACGTYSFENGDSLKEELIFQVVDGAFSLLQ